jgi:hypothetical protein
MRGPLAKQDAPHLMMDVHTADIDARNPPRPGPGGRVCAAAALARIRRVIPRATAKVNRNPISIQTAGARPVPAKTRWCHPTPQSYPPVCPATARSAGSLTVLPVTG